MSKQGATIPEDCIAEFFKINEDHDFAEKLEKSFNWIKRHLEKSPFNHPRYCRWIWCQQNMPWFIKVLNYLKNQTYGEVDFLVFDYDKVSMRIDENVSDFHWHYAYIYQELNLICWLVEKHDAESKDPPKTCISCTLPPKKPFEFYTLSDGADWDNNSTI